MQEVAAIFAGAFRRLKPRTALPRVEVQFRPFANINSTVRLRDGRLDVRLSDLLQDAPAAVLESLAFILLGKLYRQAVPARYRSRYRRFLNRRDLQRQLHLVRQLRGRKQLDGPQGHTYDLESIFQELNATYFHGLLGMPVLGWSRARSRIKLAHFDPSHNTIVVSRLFDAPDVPRYVVEYLMYHEMLHLKHPVENCRNRRRVHSPAFQQDERRFALYEQARRALKELT